MILYVNKNANWVTLKSCYTAFVEQNKKYNVENNKANIFLDFYESNMYTCKIDGINKEEIYK